MGEMSKTTEEIKNFETKKELAYIALAKVSYEGCHKIAAKALAYIQQLESNDSQVQKALQDNGFGSLEELLQAYIQVKREAGHVWISVEDELPECNTDILVFAREGKNWWHRVAYLDTAGRWARNGGGTVRGVTHWMPLPEPPKEAT